MDGSLVTAKMQEVIDLVTSDVGSIRTGRATPSLVSEIEVSVYGGAQKLKVAELATITTTDAQTIIVDPWDKSIIGEIKQGILSANASVNPTIDEEIIRIKLPPLTTEDREKYVKVLSTKIESGKIMIRQVRGDSMREIKKAYEVKEITEDQKFADEKRFQDLTDDFNDKIDKIGENKKRELLQI